MNEHMSERAGALVNAPGNVCPQTTLSNAREIRQALRGRNYGVYCTLAKEIYKVADTRMKSGTLQVRTVYGQWVQPDSVYVEG